MSNLLKFFLMALLWLVFFLVTFYGCIKPEYCPDDADAGVTTEQVTDPAPAPPPPTADYALATTLGAGSLLIGDNWPAERDALLAEYRANPDRRLEVYGHYYESELKPDDFPDMGMARASEVRDLLVTAGIPAASIELLSRRLTPPAPDAATSWDAASFAFGDPEAVDQVVELDEDNIIVRFPYDESTKNLSAPNEDYLRRLAERLQQTNERVTIVGHTDDRGGVAYNLALGQRRADFLKSRLTSYGAPAGRITTSSEGESQPEATNATGRGRRLNRRANLTLIRE